MFLLIYVDDMLLISPCVKSVKHVQKCLGDNFEMKYLVDARKILGMNMIGIENNLLSCHIRFLV